MSVQSRLEREQVRMSVKLNSAQRMNQRSWGRFLQFIIASTTPMSYMKNPAMYEDGPLTLN